MAGLLVLIVGPSGAGKDSLIDAARQQFAADPRFVFPRRIVSRPASAAEDNLEQDAAAMARQAAAGEFALYWQAHGLSYAIPGEIGAALAQDAVVICNVSRTIVPEARQRYRCFVIEIRAAPEVLAARLAGRMRASDGDVGQRLGRSAAITVLADAVCHNDGALAVSARAFCALLARIAPGQGADTA